MRLAAVLRPAGQNAAKIQALDVFWPRMRLAAVLWLAGQNILATKGPKHFGHVDFCHGGQNQAAAKTLATEKC